MQTKVEDPKSILNKSIKKDSKILQDHEGVQINNLNEKLDKVLGTNNEDKIKSEKEKKVREAVQKDFVRVGDKYYKQVDKPDKNGRTQKIYVERQKSTLTDDYGPKSHKYVKKYEGFCTVASHVNFKQEIAGFFNEYNPLSHKPKEGKFETISSVLNHVFGDKISFILDYLHLLYMRPTQRLPILLLESKEKNTGKSTFGTLLKIIFEDNAIKLGNNDFENDFNAIWIKMLCIIVDETSLDKKGIMQMIKRLSTETSKVTSNEKNKAQTQIDFIGKFVFMSNDEGRALPIERGDTRFAVFKVPTFREKGLVDDPNIENKIRLEIPAFLHYLENTKPVYPEMGRMYFDTKVYYTDQLYAYYEGSQSYIAKAIQEFIKDAFEMFPEEKVLNYSVSDIINQLTAGDYAKKSDRQQIRRALENELSMVERSRQRYEFFNLAQFHTGNNNENYNSEQRNNKVFQFTREQFKIDWRS